MSKTIVHISHTDVVRDSRIIKEIAALEENLPQYKVIGIGIKQNQKTSQNKLMTVKKNIFSISLKAKKITFLPKFIRFFFIYIEFFIKVLLILKKNPPIAIHCHDYIVLPIGFFIKILFNSKLIYDAHELESQTVSNQIKFSQGSKIVFFLEKIIWDKIDLFITVSPSILNWYNNNLGHKKNSIIVLNAPQIENKNFVKKFSIRKKYKIPKNKLIFLYVGGFQIGRGIENMLKVFTNSKVNSNLIFIGYGELENMIKKFSEKYSNIYFSKSVSHSKLVQFIKSADVGLCIIEKISLSDYYCLPNKFFEFAFSNLHILASNFPDMKKIIKKYSLGSYVEPSSAELLKKVKFFEINRNKIKIKKNNLKNLRWETQSTKLVNLQCVDKKVI
jgi:hypothetical protein